jgi:DNA-binding Lrp family transcriptional regulator
MTRGHVDEIDQEIIHALMSDARNTSAPMIAENLSVSPETVRNRIDKLEDKGVIRGYTALVDFERTDRLTSVFMCTVPADRREQLAEMAQNIQGVINVRVLMAGRRDLQIVAVGETTENLREIARVLAELDIQIEDEELLQTELHSPYSKFSSSEDQESPGVVDTVSTGEETMVIEIDVTEQAPIVGTTPQKARQQGVLPSDVIVLSIERDGRIIQPVSDVPVEPDDLVSVLPQESDKEKTVAPFLGADVSNKGE